jgi:hypothetical protein
VSTAYHTIYVDQERGWIGMRDYYSLVSGADVTTERDA